MSKVIETIQSFGKVAVLMGGTSAERDISLESGQAILAALLRAGVDAEGIDWKGGIPSELEQKKVDRVFNALHGRGGEDGTIQAVLETLELPYTGSGILGSALAMDKERTKRVWAGLGIPTPEFVAPMERPNAKEVVKKLGLPLMVKPAREGSSFGANKVEKIDQLIPAWEQAKKFDDSVLIEQWITGGEYTVGILQGAALPAIKLETPRDFYDFQAKYEEETTQYICPCGLEAHDEIEIQKIALQAFGAVACSGWGRVDLMLNEAGNPFFIEVNTVPGMTSHSLVPMGAKQQGIEFDQLVIKILETSLS
ncbi:MAG: D-alanine--D-alanine ligase [Gammaproteobacteria bacterium]